MEKLPMCRICLVKNVRINVVTNKNLQEIYEKLTEIPFVTEDSRPMLVCFFCCAKLKQCYQFQRKCLEAEELFAQMLNNDYEIKPLQLKREVDYFGGFIKTSIQHLSIVEVCHIENDYIKEEVPAVSVGLDDIIEVKVEHHSEEVEPENLDNSCLDEEFIPAHHSDSEDDVPLMKFKTEVEEGQELSKKKTGVQKKSTPTKSLQENKDEGMREEYLTVDQFHFIGENLEEDDNNKNSTKISISSNILSTKIDDSSRKETARSENETNEDCKVNTPTIRYECETCQKTFASTRTLKEHFLTHLNTWKFNCEYCLFRSNNHYNFKLHVGKHTNTFKFSCEKCPFKTNYRRNFRKHCFRHKSSEHLLENISTGVFPKTKICEICDFKTNSRKVFVTHMSKHKGNVYKCDNCSYSNHSKYNLARHITRLRH